MHRSDPVGAPDTSETEVCAPSAALTRRTERFWPEETLDKETRKTKSGNVRRCVAMARQARRTMREFDLKAECLILTIRQR